MNGLINEGLNKYIQEDEIIDFCIQAFNLD